MKKVLVLLISFCLVFNFSLKADEGMWLLPLLQKLNIKVMNDMGCELTAEEIYSINNSSLKDAIVALNGGGCTAEMISAQGLLITNHHCGYAAIQQHSSLDHDYLSDGFWAYSMDEEIVSPGYRVSFLVKIVDVSERVNRELNDEMTYDERFNKIIEISQLIEEEAVEGTHYSAGVQDFYGGNSFYLLVYETFRDIRLVGAPPSSVGKFGADTDNWMWPRHTGDFCMFRVYCGPDGKPATYSEDNIPYQPKHFLPVSVRGVEKGDFAMILGYPGGTSRYMTSYEVDQELQVTHPNRIKIRGIRQDLMLEDMLADDDIRIKYSNKYSGSTNYWKFSIGQSQSLKRLNIKEKKQKIEDKFHKWVNADSKRKDVYGDALNYIEESIKNRKKYAHSFQYLVETLLRGSEIVNYASNAIGLYQLMDETPDSLDNISRAAANLDRGIDGFFKNYNALTDKKITVAMLKLYYDNVDKEHHPDIYELIHGKFKGDYNKFVDLMFTKSIFTDPVRYRGFLNDPNKKVLEKDLALKTAQSVINKYREIFIMRSAFDIGLETGHRLFIRGLLEMQKDKVFYPDANSTMRLTYGTVGDYAPKDAVIYKHYTTLKGVMEKEDPDNWEFVVPPKLKELYDKKDYGIYGKDGVMPVCFTTNNDITGGNSGSPVINARGELIGLAFDGNWEAMSGDIVFETELQKCINVDIRYVLFIIDKYAGAKNLIDEMTIVK